MYYKFKDSTKTLLNLKQIASMYQDIEHTHANIYITLKSGSEIVLFYGNRESQQTLENINSDFNTVTHILTDKHQYIKR